ncbi:FAD-dependent monooxygenase [Enterovirga rhinocerotis]|uniref:2-octaprenyl-6-methoxyphenol hydroxylase n=1 Tax=Enterovirga rhinocerotis TaxID=1339210 RepID=A0A4R7C512_9HYPH|nr:FAD-dependent monooxygenase [Enterovirga rhinocerotis]TDR93123.1 2-octaprenyl-6-methoxyphenol hydroxylase [Enterovirga rhinocerotis]
MGTQFDIAVVGAGPVGLLGAIALVRSGWRVALAGPEPDGRDGRTAALLAPSIDLLRDLDLWPSLAPEAGPLRRLRLVDDTDSLFRPPPVEFRCEEIGLDAFGWNVENARLTAILADAVRAEPGIAWHTGLAEDFVSGDPASLVLADGTRIEADLVVAADGRRSRVREAAGIGASERRYRQTAVTAIFRHDRPHGEVSTEFHKRFGPMTLVPMPARGDGIWRSSLVWVTEPHHARRLAALDADTLARAVEAGCHDILGTMILDGPRGAVPLAAMHAHRFVGDRLALAGEAAHVLPPIGAQGLNLGFADIACLRRLVRPGLDPGHPASLARYDRERRSDARLRGFAVDGLNRALLSGSSLLDAARGLSLGLIGQIGPLRRAVMRAGLPPQATA